MSIIPTLYFFVEFLSEKIIPSKKKIYILSKAALSLLREFHRFADALTKLLDPYLPGFPGGTISKFDSADLIRHDQFTQIPWCQTMQCFIRI